MFIYGTLFVMIGKFLCKNFIETSFTCNCKFIDMELRELIHNVQDGDSLSSRQRDFK